MLRPRFTRPAQLPALALTVLLSLVATGAAACGRGADRAGTGGTAGSGGSTDGRTAASTTSSSASASGPASCTAGDLAVYERGLAKELELVQAARKRAEVAKSPAERGEAMQAQWEDQTAPEAARAIGASPERYRQTRDAVNHVLETLDFQGKIDGPMSMDTAHASPEMRARLTSDPYSTLTPEAASALRARLGRIVPLWSQYVNLTAVAG